MALVQWMDRISNATKTKSTDQLAKKLWHNVLTHQLPKSWECCGDTNAATEWDDDLVEVAKTSNVDPRALLSARDLARFFPRS